MKTSINVLGTLALLDALTGCAGLPVQERTRVNGQGGSITCKQVGRGLISGPVGKASLDSCAQDAINQGHK